MRARVSVIAAAIALSVLLTATTASAAPWTRIRTDNYSNGGGYGTAYADRDMGNINNWRMQAYADDNDAVSIFCVETWFDFATDPHSHIDPVVVRDCGGSPGWSPVRNYNNQWIVNFESAICRVDTRNNNRFECVSYQGWPVESIWDYSAPGTGDYVYYSV